MSEKMNYLAGAKLIADQMERATELIVEILLVLQDREITDRIEALEQIVQRLILDRDRANAPGLPPEPAPKKAQPQ